MKNTLLLPRICKLIGSILLPFAITWLVVGYLGNKTVFPFLEYKNVTATKSFFPSDFIFSKSFSTDFNGELSILTTLICLFMMAFSREKVEDEYVRSVRLSALQVSIYANYIILAIASLLFYGFSYVYVLQANLFTMLIIFIIVFYYKLHIRSRITENQPS